MDAKTCALGLIADCRGKSRLTEGDARALIREAIQHADEVKPVPDGRRGPSNLELDFQAPSVWHAACSVLSMFQLERFRRGNYAANQTMVDTFFGNRLAFRGQAQGWPIMPSLWRPQNKRIRDLGDSPLEVYRHFIQSHLDQANDIGLELFPKLSRAEGIQAVAQHYGFPTSMVDFTFDPLVAFHFAVGRSENAVQSGGSIHFIPFIKLRAVSAMAGMADHLTFPPVHVQRLYRQAGLFVDFTPQRRKLKVDADPEATWSDLEGNCAKISFPRSYPDFLEADALRIPGLEEDEPFFSQSLSLLRQVCQDGMEFDPEKAGAHVMIGTRARPPWSGQGDDFRNGGYFVTDKYFADALGQYLLYVKRAAHVVFGSEEHLDPFIVGAIIGHEPEPILALGQLVDSGRLKYHPGIVADFRKVKAAYEDFRLLYLAKTGP